MTATGPGEALDHAHDQGTCSVGMCLKYVRTWWEVDGLYGSAIDAWNGARFKHPGDRNPPDGAPCFYRGGNYGHIVMADYSGHPGQRGTDSPSSGKVSDQAISWVEDAWGYDYLGWTEDLNGVTLPLGDEDEMTDDDFKRIRTIVQEEVAKNNAAATDAVWNEEQTVTKPNGDTDSKSLRQIARETWQRVAKMET